MTSIPMSICNLSLKSRDVLIWNDCQGLQLFSPENYIFLFTKLYHITSMRQLLKNENESTCCYVKSSVTHAKFTMHIEYKTQRESNQFGWKLYWWENWGKIAMQQSQRYYLWWNICIFLLLSCIPRSRQYALLPAFCF